MFNTLPIIRSILNSIIKMTFYVQKQSFLHQMNANYVYFFNCDNTTNLTIIVICCLSIEYHKYLMEKSNKNKIWIIIQFDHKTIISWPKSIIFEYLECILLIECKSNELLHVNVTYFSDIIALCCIYFETNKNGQILKIAINN